MGFPKSNLFFLESPKNQGNPEISLSGFPWISGNPREKRWDFPESHEKKMGSIEIPGKKDWIPGNSRENRGSVIGVPQ